MKSFLVTIFCLIGGALAAETIGDVEYAVPSKWQVGTEIKNEKMTGIFYVPEEGKEGVVECFSVTLTHEAGDFDVKELERGLQLLFPEQEGRVNVLEETADSILYEWSIGEGSFYGWGRVFPKENVLISYQTNQSDEEGNIRSVWMTRLQEAHVN